MTDAKPEHQSALFRAIAERAKDRPLEHFPLSGYFSLGDKPILGTKIRVPTKWEEHNALDLAHQYIKRNVGEDESKKDARIVQDAENTAIVWHACRDEDDPLHPAFPSPDVMHKKLTSDQIGVLVNLVNGVRVKHSPQPLPLTPETLDSVVKVAAELGTSDIPDRVLAGWPREVVVSAFVMLAMRAVTLEDELAALRLEVDRLRAIAEPEAAPAAEMSVAGSDEVEPDEAEPPPEE